METSGIQDFGIGLRVWGLGFRVQGTIPCVLCARRLHGAMERVWRRVLTVRLRIDRRRAGASHVVPPYVVSDEEVDGGGGGGARHNPFVVSGSQHQPLNDETERQPMDEDDGEDEGRVGEGARVQPLPLDDDEDDEAPFIPMPDYDDDEDDAHLAHGADGRPGWHPHQRLDGGDTTDDEFAAAPGRAPGSSAVNVTHDSIAPSPAQQAEMRRAGRAGLGAPGPAQPRARRGPRGGLRARVEARFDFQTLNP